MYKPLIAILIVLFLFTSPATANPNDCVLHQINTTHWYFETNQTDLVYGTYNYQAFANNISSDYRILNFSSAPTGYSVGGTIFGAAGLGEGQVIVSLGSDSTTTSSSGSYSFTGVLAGTYTLTASKSGLQDASTTITVSGDTTQDLTMTIAESPGGGGQQSSDWGIEFNISGPISRLDGLATSLKDPTGPDPHIQTIFGIGILCIGVFIFVDGLAFHIDKSRKKTFTKLNYKILITAGLGLGILGAAISKLIIFL